MFAYRSDVTRLPRLYSRASCGLDRRVTVFVSVDLLPGGVIGNSPGSGPGIQGSSPCPAAVSSDRPEIARDVLNIGHATAHIGPDDQQPTSVLQIVRAPYAQCSGHP